MTSCDTSIGGLTEFHSYVHITITFLFGESQSIGVQGRFSVDSKVKSEFLMKLVSVWVVRNEFAFNY